MSILRSRAFLIIAVAACIAAGIVYFFGPTIQASEGASCPLNGPWICPPGTEYWCIDVCGDWDNDGSVTCDVSESCWPPSEAYYEGYNYGQGYYEGYYYGQGYYEGYYYGQGYYEGYYQGYYEGYYYGQGYYEGYYYGQGYYQSYYQGAYGYSEGYYYGQGYYQGYYEGYYEGGYYGQGYYQGSYYSQGAYAPTCSGANATITAAPTRIRSGQTASLTVSATGITTSCTVTGPGINQNYTPSSCNVSGSITTPVLTKQSVYTISCDSGAVVKKVIINVVPRFWLF